MNELIAAATALADAVDAETEYLTAHKFSQVAEADGLRPFESAVVECSARLRAVLAEVSA